MCSSASQGEPSVTSLRALAVLGAIFKKQVRHLTRYPAEFIFVLIIPYFLTAMVVAMGTSVGGAGAASNFSAQTGSTLNPFVFLIIGADVWMISWMEIWDYEDEDELGRV